MTTNFIHSEASVSEVNLPYNQTSINITFHNMGPLNIKVRGFLGEYLNTAGLKTPFVQSRQEEELHHHLTATSGYRKSQYGCLCD